MNLIRKTDVLLLLSMNRLYYVVFLCLIGMTSSCSKDSSKKYFAEMMSNPLCVNRAKYISVSSDSLSVKPFSKYRLIRYVDASYCGLCTYKQVCSDLSNIDELLQIPQTVIIKIHSTDMTQIKFYSKILKNRYEVLLDTAEVFVCENRFVPDNNKYRIFLVDNNDSIILIGNPLSNKRMLELYKQVVARK